MKRGEAGVTLIEILVAITLLSLLVVGMTMALRGGLTSYSKVEDKLMANRRIAGAQRIVQSELEGLVPAYVMCGAGAGGPGQRAIFFQGTPGSLTMVSTFSLQQGWRGQPQILQMFVIPGGEGGGVRLVVNELPYNGPFSAGPLCVGTATITGTIARLALFVPPMPSPKSFILADKLALANFAYYAPSPTYGQRPSWQTNWAARGWPLAVRIEMAPNSVDRSQLQSITVAAPIHVRRDADQAYVDHPF